MRILKKIFALSLVAALLLTAAGCHKKNETAVTVGDVKFTSAYYMCALLYADSEARSKVQESLTDEEKEATDIDYFSKKVEDTEYEKWVKDRAIKLLTDIAAYKTKCKENKLELDEETASYAEQYASYYWSSYGYGQMFEPNGVSQATYTQYMKDGYYSNLYFEKLYGKDGEKEIAADTVRAKTLENFVLADKIEVTYSESDDKTAIKAKFDNYVASLQNGTMTFEAVYKDYNNKTDEEEAEDSTEELKPVDKYASILGASDTGYASDYYDTAKAMAKGEVKLIETENSAGLVLLVKQELSEDEYYVDSLDLSSRHLIADEEYTADMEEFGKSLKSNIVKYAIDQFNVKKIIYPETNAAS